MQNESNERGKHICTRYTGIRREGKSTQRTPPNKIVDLVFSEVLDSAHRVNKFTYARSRVSTRQEE
jgi:hypothetical protein